jgi:hypothetical protein
MRAAWHWLVLGAALYTTALAAQPPPAQPQQPSSEPVAPDDEFIEFLGADDVGDAAWWEFLKKAAPRKDLPPAPPPQDAKQ